MFFAKIWPKVITMKKWVLLNWSYKTSYCFHLERWGIRQEKFESFKKSINNLFEIFRKDIFKIMNNNIIQLLNFDKKIFKQLSSDL